MDKDFRFETALHGHSVVRNTDTPRRRGHDCWIMFHPHATDPVRTGRPMSEWKVFSLVHKLRLAYRRGAGEE